MSYAVKTKWDNELLRIVNLPKDVPQYKNYMTGRVLMMAESLEFRKKIIKYFCKYIDHFEQTNKWYNFAKYGPNDRKGIFNKSYLYRNLSKILQNKKDNDEIYFLTFDEKGNEIKEIEVV